MRNDRTILPRIIFLLASVAIFISCTTSNQTVGQTIRPSYDVGDPGPAGGIVFFDKGEESNGWRYLEVAPAESEVSLPWSNGEFQVETETIVGSGAANTDMLDAIEENIAETAASYCKRMDLNEFSDWFLPSKDELNLVFTTLARQGVGTFLGEGHAYWSSSDYDERRAWAQGFFHGVQGRVEKGELLTVRAIRAF